MPLRHRFHALGSCVQLNRPLGFTATWTYLQDVLALEWRDPAFLVPAVDLLAAQRSRHRGVTAAYARIRYAEKALGRRVPAPWTVTPTSPRRWHGDEQRGAAHALHQWRRTGAGPAGHPILEIVDVALATGALPAPPESLQALLDGVRGHAVAGRRADGRTAAPGHQADPPADRGDAELAYVLGQLYLLAGGPVVLAHEWNFVAPTCTPSAD